LPRVGNADSGFIFPGNCHGFIDPDRFETGIWQPIVEQAELAGTRFRDLRHFLASQLIANGETAACVRDQMGHSSIHVTFDTYGLFPGRVREASDRYEKSIDVAGRKSEAAASLLAKLALRNASNPCDRFERIGCGGRI
jgi:integrase